MFDDLPSVTELVNIKNKRVLLRIDTNVPLVSGQVYDDFRLRQAAKTIDWLKGSGARVITLGHHGDKDNKESLRPIADYFGIEILGLKFDQFTTERISSLQAGQIIMLENLRLDDGEMLNSLDFAKNLALFGDIYVNEAFSVSHRDHASITLLPKLLPSYFGFNFLDEVSNLSQAFAPSHSFIFILGGAKFKTKIKLVNKFLKTADKIFIGGALANNFFKAKGYEVGLSLVDREELGLDSFMNNPKIVLPEDVVVLSDDQKKIVKNIDQVLDSDNILDNGPKFVRRIKEELVGAKFVLWNGPLGNFEEGFNDSTVELALAISSSEAHTIIGGGDTLAAINRLQIFDKFGFVSTGGGAMLDFLSEGTLPGIEAVRETY